MLQFRWKKIHRNSSVRVTAYLKRMDSKLRWFDWRSCIRLVTTACNLYWLLRRELVRGRVYSSYFDAFAWNLRAVRRYSVAGASSLNLVSVPVLVPRVSSTAVSAAVSGCDVTEPHALHSNTSSLRHRSSHYHR